MNENSLNNSDEVSARLRSSLNAPTPELSADIVTGAAARPAPHTVNRGRRVQLASGVTLAVAAAAVTALVISPSLNRAPLFTAAGNNGGSPMATSEDASSDMRIANWVNYEYVAGEGLSTSGGADHVYQLQRVGTPEQVLADAAAAFTVEGEPHKASYFDPAYPTYIIGPDDGTAPSVTVSWTGTGDWWYSDPSAYPAIVCEPAPADDTAVDGDTYAGEICSTPEVAENLAPSESEARSQAASIFETTGLDVDESDIRVVADEWQTSASASLVVDGEQTALEWVVSWAPSGVISWAYGHSIDVVDKGEYGTVSPAAAIDRIADGRWWGQAGPKYQGGMTLFANDSGREAEAGATEEPTDAATDDAATDDTATDDTGTDDTGTGDTGTEPTVKPTEPAPDGDGQSGEEPGDPGVAPDQPVEPVDPSLEPDPGLSPEPLPVPEEPETVTVTVEEAFETLLLVWDTDGNAWLVPGYAVQNPEDWYVTIVSLVEGVIALPEPMQIEPYPLEEDLIRE